jgi:hypothetical protein
MRHRKQDCGSAGGRAVDSRVAPVIRRVDGDYCTRGMV